MNSQQFITNAVAAIAATAIKDLLQKRQAIVLERIARGGGATNWYYCCDIDGLDAIVKLIRPGSIVSFYFDDRISHTPPDAETIERMGEMVAQHREMMVGTLSEDNIIIDYGYVEGPISLKEFLSALNPGSEVFYGPFPASDNDGVNSVTILMPDADGIVRKHPY